MNKYSLKNIFFIAIIVFLLVSVCVTGIFSTRTNDYSPYTVGRLSIYNEDGTNFVYENKKNSSVKLSVGDTSLASAHKITNVVVFICFSDEDVSSFRNLLNDGFISRFNGGVPSLYSYYHALSYGELVVNSIFATNETLFYIYRDNKARSYYDEIVETSGSKRYTAESSLLNSAIQQADDFFDYTDVDLDVNDDGYVDSVSFVINGIKQDEWGGLMWPHAWELDVISGASNPATTSTTLNGIQVNDYTFTFAGESSLGLITHEFGHLLGMPDLYHYDKGTPLFPDNNANYLPVGYWDLMHKECDVPQFTTTYMRYKYLSFVSKEQITELSESGTYTLKPTTTTSKEETLAYCITVSDTESIWMEFRSKNQGAYDSLLPSSGLIVYRINNTVQGNEEGRPKSTRYPYEIFIFRPDCAPSSYSTMNAEYYNLGYAGLSIDNENFSSLGNTTSTTKYDSNCIYLTDGSNTGISIVITEETDDLITFSVELSSFDASTVSSSYVSGRDLSGKTVKDLHYSYLGEPLEVSLFVKYGNRTSYAEITDFTIEYENTFSPEGQTAYAVFTHANKEYRSPFTLYLYRSNVLSVTVVRQPEKTIYSIGDEIDLSGLSITVAYSSGNENYFSYSQSEKNLWKVTEGVDMNSVGVYPKVKVVYNDTVNFYIAPITVNGKVVSIRVIEKDTKHIASNTLSAKFNVVAVYEGGSETKLNENQYSVEYLTSVNYQKNVVKIIYNGDETITTNSYVHLVGNSRVQSITHEITDEESLYFGQSPSFSKGKLAFTFDNGYVISGENALPTENYRTDILQSFSPTKTGMQSMRVDVDDGYFTVSVTVYVKTENILSQVTDNVHSDNIIINKAKNYVLLKEDVTLSDLASSLGSYLTIGFVNTVDSFVLSTNTHGGRLIGESTKLVLLSQDGERIVEYSLYRLGDGNGDGSVTYQDIAFWTQSLLKNENKVSFDVDEDGAYTLKDLVLLNELYGGEIR